MCFFHTCSLQPERRCIFSRKKDQLSKIPEIVFEKKRVLIGGRPHLIVPSKNTPVSLYYRGQYYEAPEEVWIAKLLRKAGIPFRHHVRFDVALKIENQLREYHWHPDFLFDRPLEWCGYHKEGTIISGIEVKKKKMNGKPQLLSNGVKKKYGLRILVINQKIIRPWYDARLLPVQEL